MTERSKDLPRGSILDNRYSIETVLGRGGMGTVYEAIHLAIDRSVAIKLLRPAIASEPRAFERFRREARAAGSIGHDNICEVTDFGHTEDGSPFLVMPLLKGSSLADLLACERIPLGRFVDMMSQTLSALQAAHEASIVHRDLKPENIFVTRIGDRDDFIKLLDFGASKLLVQKEATNLTETGQTLGTPYYMAPEQALGYDDIDQRIDIYAMGIILYEAFTGRKPFRGRTKNEVMVKIVSGAAPTPTSLNPQLPEPLNLIILRAMSREIEQRQNSAAELRRELQAFAQTHTGELSTVLTVNRQHNSLTSAPTAHTHNLRPPSTSEAATAKTRLETSVGASSQRSLKKLVWSALGLTLLLGVLVFFIFGPGSFALYKGPTPQSATAPSTLSEVSPSSSPKASSTALSPPATAAPPTEEAQEPGAEPEALTKSEEKTEEAKTPSDPRSPSQSTANTRKKSRRSKRKSKSEVIEGQTGTRFYTDF